MLELKRFNLENLIQYGATKDSRLNPVFHGTSKHIKYRLAVGIFALPVGWVAVFIVDRRFAVLGPLMHVLLWCADALLSLPVTLLQLIVARVVWRRELKAAVFRKDRITRQIARIDRVKINQIIFSDEHTAAKGHVLADKLHQPRRGHPHGVAL